MRLDGENRPAKRKMAASCRGAGTVPTACSPYHRDSVWVWGNESYGFRTV